MITWGINANNHDASLAVFADEKLVYASHSERYSRTKNDRDLCDEMINIANGKYGYPDKVIWFEKPILKYTRQLFSGEKYLYQSPKKYLKQYNIDAPVKYIGHHHGHAASAFFTSGMEESAVLVVDSIGEWDTVSIWQGRGNSLTQIWSQKYPNSIGLFYSAMTDRIGLKPNEEEYILMGMAAYGKPTLVEQMDKDFFEGVSIKVNVHRGARGWMRLADEFDIASSTQHIFERTLFYYASLARELTGSRNLCYAGGCALNCSANSILPDMFDNVWIFPNPGDSGLAVGSVLAHFGKHIEWENNFLGFEIKNKPNIKRMVGNLLNEEIIGIATGKAEFGPRALGNRSLLADPRPAGMKDKVNKIKQRQEFRPFAPVVLEEFAKDYFILSDNVNYEYMQYAVPCKRKDDIPAVVHVDGTSRVQVVPKNNSFIRQLLEQWYNYSGCPILLNTSLNIKGMPIVNDRDDAKQFQSYYGVKVY